LLGYGVVLIKFGKKVQQLQKLHILTILTLVLTAGLLLEQLGHVGNSNITVLNGFF
jgi:hypothetical protein